MINPDQIRAIERNRIATPDILRVQIRDRNILDDDVFGPSAEAKAFAFDHSQTSHAEDGLVGGDIDRSASRFVPSAFDRWGSAAAALDDLLARRSGSPARAGRAGFGPFGGCEVEDFVQDDDTGAGVSEVRLQLSDVGWVDRFGVPAAGYTFGESLSCAVDTLCRDEVRKGREGMDEDGWVLHVGFAGFVCEREDGEDVEGQYFPQPRT